MSVAKRTTKLAAYQPVLAALCIVAVTAACSPQRSAASFCNTLRDESVALHAKYVDRAGSLDQENEPLASMFVAFGSLIEAQGDLIVMLDKLEAVAPEEIRAEVAAVRSSLERQLEASGNAVSDPLGGLGGSLIAGLSAMGSYQALDEFINANCDLSYMSGS